MHVIALIALGGFLAWAITKSADEAKPEAYGGSRADVVVFVNNIKTGTTVIKADVEKWYKVAVDNQQPERLYLQNVLMQLKASGMNLYQVEK